MFRSISALSISEYSGFSPQITKKHNPVSRYPAMTFIFLPERLPKK